MTKQEIIKEMEELKNLCNHYSRQCAHYLGRKDCLKEYQQASNNLNFFNSHLNKMKNKLFALEKEVGNENN